MLQLQKIDDPRDAYAKLRRKECEILAKEAGIPWEPGVPALVIQRRLRAARVAIPPQVGARVLGAPVNNPPESAEVEVSGGDTSDAVDALERDWKQNSYEGMSIQDLRKLAKGKGLALARTDKQADIIAKIRGADGHAAGRS